MKHMRFAGLVLAVGVILSIPFGKASARLTGTEPGNDIWCMGPSGAEVCIDVSGNIVPTTTSDTTLGSSSLYWSALYVDDITVSDDMTVADDLTVSGDVTVTGGLDVTGNILGPTTSVQRLNTGSTEDLKGVSDIIVANACGGIKLIHTYNLASDAMVTSTNNTFTSPSAALAGCAMDVLNIGTQNITLDAQDDFVTFGGLDVVLTSSDSVRVGCTGSYWYQLATQSVNE